MSRKAWLAGLIPAAAAAVALGSIVATRKAPPPMNPASPPARAASARPAVEPAAAPKPVETPVALASAAIRPLDMTTHPPVDRGAKLRENLAKMKEHMRDGMEEAAENPSKFKNKFEDKLKKEGSGWDKWFFSQRTYPNKKMPFGATQKALDSAATHNTFQGRNGHLPSALPKWESLGPSTIPNGQTDSGNDDSIPLTNVSGRVSAIAVDPYDPAVVYIGGAQGGVWKTTNATAPSPTWTPLTDKEASLAVGSIAIDPDDSNTIYVGTGEPNQSCDSYYGHGILRSTDGGLTWLQINGGTIGNPNTPIFDGRSVDKIIVDAVPGRIFASTQVAYLASGTAACQIANGNAPTGGLYMSGDQGQHWINIPIFFSSDFYNVTDMVLDPTDGSGNTLYVGVADTALGVLGLDTTPDSDNGIWKTTDLGSSWTQLSQGLPNPNQNFINRISLTIGADGAVAAAYTSGSTQRGIYRTTDGGSTWNAPTNGNDSGTFGHNVNIAANGNVTELTGGTDFNTDGSWVGRRFIWDPTGTGFDIRVNVITGVTDSSHLTITAPQDASAHPNSGWAVGSFPGYCDGQCSYDMTIGIDPQVALGQTLYIGGNPNFYGNDGVDPNAGVHTEWLSTDAGNTWTGISQSTNLTGGIHTDDHALAFDTSTSPSTLYDGNDGGAWSTANMGGDWLDLNTNLAITQFQGISTHPTNPDILLGGTQDNGTLLLDEADTGVIAPAWYHSQFGDGGQTLIDQNDPARVLHTFFNETHFLIGPEISFDGGTNNGLGWTFVGGYDGSLFYNPYYAAYSGNGIDMADPVQFYLPLAQNEAAGVSSPASPNSRLRPHALGDPDSVIYLGTNKLYRSPDPYPWYITLPYYSYLCGGSPCPPAWTVKSPPLTNPSDSFDALMAIGVYPNLVGGEEVLFTGSFDGVVYASKTVDGNPGPATWYRLDNTGSGSLPPNRTVTQILADPTDATGQSAFVTYSGFNSNSVTPGHIFKVTNAFGSPIWYDLSGDLPDLPTNAVAFDDLNNIVYVGNDIGVFETLDGGSHWNYLNTGMPNVTVFGLERNPTTGEVVASTHGRGAFQLIANGAFDSTSPVCQPGFYDFDVNGTEYYVGEASDSGPNDTGISTIVMDPGATNLVVTNKTFTSPQHATYEVHLIEPCLPGDGDVIVTDFGGNTCSVHIHLDANPALTEDLSISMSDDTWNGSFYPFTVTPELIGTGYDITAGNQIDYTLTVTNNGPAGAGDVVVTDTPPPAGLVSANWYSSLSNLQNNVSPTACTGTNPITCDLGPMSSGQSLYIEISVVPNVVAGTEIVNSATVSDAAPLIATSCDPDDSNNTASDTNQIEASVLTPYALVIEDGGNGIIEPGETFGIDPYWENDGRAPNAFTGTATSWTGPIDLLVNMYDLSDTEADYGLVLPGHGFNHQDPPLDISDCTQTADGCYVATLNPPSQGRPAMHWDTVMTEQLSSGDTKSWILHVGDSFSDVPTSSPYYYFIEALLHNNVTVGCGTGFNGQGLFCPASLVTREQMAAFIARAVLGGDFNVPTSEGSGPHPYDCTGGIGSNFTDVPVGYPFCSQINWIYNHGITNGCGPTTFCPTTPIPREQMATLVARERAGGDGLVPVSVNVGPRQYDCTSSNPSDWPFTDVPNTNIYCKYIGYLWSENVINGYAPAHITFGPTDTLTREQASVFIINGLLVPAPPDPNAAPMKLYKP